MRGGAHADDGAAGFDVANDVLQLLVGQIQPSHEYDHQVGGVEGFQAGDVRLVGIDRAIFRIDAIEHRTLEAVARG